MKRKELCLLNAKDLPLVPVPQARGLLSGCELPLLHLRWRASHERTSEELRKRKKKTTGQCELKNPVQPTPVKQEDCVLNAREHHEEDHDALLPLNVEERPPQVEIEREVDVGPRHAREGREDRDAEHDTLNRIPRSRHLLSCANWKVQTGCAVAAADQARITPSVPNCPSRNSSNLPKIAKNAAADLKDLAESQRFFKCCWWRAARAVESATADGGPNHETLGFLPFATLKNNLKRKEKSFECASGFEA
ncbi:hypothetical protein Efla_007144 [Eimeria flavescens]